MKKTNPRIFLGIVGTIIIGIITNALWDGIKPFTGYLYERVLYVSIFGVEKFKDGIYTDIAKGYHENISLDIYILFHSALISFIFFALILLTMKHLYKNGNEQIANKIEKIIGWPNYLRTKSFLIFVILYTIFALTIISLNLAKTKYVNESITYYSQLVKITNPYLDIKEIGKIESRFSQIKNKTDFESIIEDLLEIVDANNLSKPEFKFIF